MIIIYQENHENLCSIPPAMLPVCSSSHIHRRNPREYILVLEKLQRCFGHFFRKDVCQNVSKCDQPAHDAFCLTDSCCFVMISSSASGLFPSTVVTSLLQEHRL